MTTGAESKMRRFLGKFGIYFVLILTSVIVVFPFYLTVLTAFKQPVDARNFFLALPVKWSFDNFEQVLTRGGYWDALKNSAIITVIATFGTMARAISPPRLPLTKSFCISTTTISSIFSLIHILPFGERSRPFLEHQRGLGIPFSQGTPTWHLPQP